MESNRLFTVRKNNRDFLNGWLDETKNFTLYLFADWGHFLFYFFLGDFIFNSKGAIDFVLKHNCKEFYYHSLYPETILVHFVSNFKPSLLEKIKGFISAFSVSYVL